MNVEFHHNFRKRYHKLNSTIRAKTDERLVLFRKEQFHPVLNNHGLQGKYTGYRSINTAGDYRAIYKLLKDDLAFFITVGTHSNLYK